MSDISLNIEIEERDFFQNMKFHGKMDIPKIHQIPRKFFSRFDRRISNFAFFSRFFTTEFKFIYKLLIKMAPKCPKT